MVGQRTEYRPGRHEAHPIDIQLTELDYLDAGLVEGVASNEVTDKRAFFDDVAS